MLFSQLFKTKQNKTKKQTIIFLIGGATETMAGCQTIQTIYFVSPATSEGISKLAGIKSEPWAMNANN